MAVDAYGTVASIMTPDPVRVSMDDTVWQVRQLMARRRFHHVLVADEKGRLAGILSDRDVLAAVSPAADTPYARASDADTLQRRVHQIMSRAVVQVSPDTPIVDAAAAMLEHGIHCLPVADGDRCVGIVTSADLLRWFVDGTRGQRIAAA
jgi:acetoin utilization protein AcuB